MDNKNSSGKITKVSIPKNQPNKIKPVKNFNIKPLKTKNTGRGR